MNYRSFFQLHQDSWRCALRYPVYFFILPALLYFPFDFVSEWIVRKSQGDFWQSMKIYYRVGQIAEFLVGGLLISIQLELLRRIAKKEPTAFSSVLKAGFKLFPRILCLSILISVNIGLRLLLLIVPGVIKGVKLSLTLPVHVFEGLPAQAALNRSEELMNGHGRRLFGWSLLAITIYWVGILGYYCFIPEKNSPLQLALGSIPVNMITSLWTIGFCLYYADCTGKLDFSRPVGLPSPQRPDFDPSGTDHVSPKSVWAAVIISLVLFISGFIFVSQQPYFEGEKVTFGEASHELYFNADISENVIEQVTTACLENSLFQTDEFWILLLEQT